MGWVGYRTTRNRPFPGEAIPLTVSRARPKSYMHVIHTLVTDPEGRYLTVQRSSYGLYLDPDLESVVFHYDYDREPEGEYPEAHVQVVGESVPLAELNSRVDVEKRLGDLHFPVGGRRYRPSLEDLIEFLVVEGYVRSREGWRHVLETHRTEFQRRQLMAAVRRDPVTAMEELRRHGYRVDYPE